MRHLFIAAVIAASAAGCGIDKRTAAYRCTDDSDCDGDRRCEEGYCTLGPRDLSDSSPGGYIGGIWQTASNGSNAKFRYYKYGTQAGDGIDMELYPSTAGAQAVTLRAEATSTNGSSQYSPREPLRTSSIDAPRSTASLAMARAVSSAPTSEASR